ncbi:ribbon-helix-helix domain-containing protein [Robiginitomaculum antarcticum]|uniref:ribbon-helix-helix domain-containing protein n=1 Tax=Robiginitomaculum antarcticum TaxID=437507 RepID=UPI000372B588|nr:ribbon-helix-helix domain-containing protein [Robiginitomaculum antarcticum]
MTRIKRSVSLHGHATSVALEREFWLIIDDHIASSDKSLAGFLAQMDDARVAEKYDGGLAGYLRVWAVRRIMTD